MKFLEGREFNQLAVRMKKGDSEAASKMYEKLFDKVFGFCMNRVSSKPLAEDLTQDIFLKLVSKIESFDHKKGNFIVWFWQLARNTVTDHYRKARDISFSDTSEEALDLKSAIETHKNLDAKLELEKVTQFLDSATSDERELFNLHFVAELDYREISEVLGKSEGALRVAVNRLKNKVKKKFA